MSFKSEINNNSERIFVSNLRLLGFESEDKDVVLSCEIFDHPNTKAFHQVMFFLFKKLDGERCRQEFRDCWPVLDKKQESEFRKKCSNWLKEIQRCNPEDISHVNPALFQSPGGRKFVIFLRGFSKYVLLQHLNQDDTFYFKKPPSKRKETVKLAFKNLILRNEDNISEAVKYQQEIHESLASAKPSAETISKKYFEMKTRKETLKKALDEKKKEIEDCHVGERKEYIDICTEYEQRYTALKETAKHLRERIDSSNAVAENILQLTDQNIVRPSLDFTHTPKELVKDTDLIMTFDHLLQHGSNCYKKCLELPTETHFSKAPLQEMKNKLDALTAQAASLRDLKISLSNLKPELLHNVESLGKISADIDWKSVFLDSNEKKAESPELVLLPPTPNGMLDITSAHSNHSSSIRHAKTPEIISRLKLYSPTLPGGLQNKSASKYLQDGSGLQSITPTSRNIRKINRQLTPDQMQNVLKVTPDPKKFSRKVTPDHSPLLKMSLIQSTIQKQTNLVNSEQAGRLREDSISSQVSESKASLEAFSPGLCSTRLLKPDELPNIPLTEPNFQIPTIKATNFNKPIEQGAYKNNITVQDDQLRSRSSFGDIVDLDNEPSFANPKTSISVLTEASELCDSASEGEEINNKIDKYRKFLQSVQSHIPRKIEVAGGEISKIKNDLIHKKVTVSESATNQKDDRMLTDIWSQARISISPRTSPAVGRLSKLSGIGDLNIDSSFTGGEGEPAADTSIVEPLDNSDLNIQLETKQAVDLVGTRLEALMESLTLSDSCSDFSLSMSRMSFGEDLMLSPHCP